ncbi:DUF4405 domain-containing protein [Anaerolineales bacterium HSG6]|nr:DUF4405 domain-containing protein [Anaerolineales bacterium HSG6]
MKQPKKTSSNQIKLYADIILLTAFILTNVPHATGIPLHEWISILFIIPILVHILLDWKWVVNVTKRMFKRLPGEVRFNHIWDLLIFIMMVFVLLNGFLISEAALPALGIHVTIDPFWSAMHNQSANLLMVMVGVHLAMHWSWIVSMIKRYVLYKPAQITQSTPQRGK